MTSKVKVEIFEKLMKYEDIVFLLAFIVLAYIYLGANILSGEIVAPMDLLLRYPGYRESGLSLPLYNPERSDILDWLLPQWIFIREEILKGNIPLWNPLRNYGVPVFYAIEPSFVIFLLFGGGIGFTLGLIAKLVVAGFGVYKLCREDLGILPSFFAGITYMMCGFNASWLMWPQVSTSAWIPWVLWTGRKVVETRRLSWIVALALTTSMLIFGYFPFITALGLYLLVLYIAWIIFINRKNISRNLSLILLKVSSGIILGILLASVFIFPFVEWMHVVDTSWRHAGSALSLRDIDIFWNIKYYFKIGDHLVPRVEKTGYVGKVVIILSFFVILCLLKKNRHILFRGVSPIFWLLIFVITLVVAFNIKPVSSLLYAIPPFNNNPSHRAIVFADLGLAIVSAVGMELLIVSVRDLAKNLIRENIGMALLLIAIAVLVVIHYFDLSTVGRSQNAVVPAETFYPIAPTIKYVKESLIPGQQVIATTDAYLISGTLTAYGVPEPFAHGYFRAEEKEILSHIVRKAWRTPTATIFTFEKIEINDSKYIDKLFIRYILTSRLPISQTQNDKPAPPIPPNIIGQTFKIKENFTLFGFSILMATYGKETVNTDVVLEVYKDKHNISTKILSILINSNEIKDNKWINVRLKQPIKLTPGSYHIQLRALKNNTDPVTVWTLRKTDAYEDGHLTVNGKPLGGDIAFRVIGIPDGIAKHWDVYTLTGDVFIFENRDCPPGAYLIDNDDEIISNATIKIIQYSTNYIKYCIETNKSGLLVVPIRVWPGWQVDVNGERTTVIPYLEMLSAVHVDAGKSIVEFRYDPLTFKVGAITSFITLIILLALVIVDRKLRCKHNETRCNDSCF
ncbi:YfhO family protein [Archaeoglobus profundus]|uniref:Membrane protein 6-pyruvoyl-tetrahydropterin synthase-related domain-containing protein n=1 Tax=Archaeoglobus profundus (strain DSM 5631 / JCM 9629 / NBRC 100127 / Av18) TaxID=572546 RepID=D2RDR6_ARCPA|nr:YfhO family protein [Archaeoglobus profundus]ADB58260.1 hypothetical protein Arcpr_1208 [Archaeoglobus profundus DSM 5631]